MASLSVGPLSQGLNVIYGPAGSGKTNLHAFVTTCFEPARQTTFAAQNVATKQALKTLGYASGTLEWRDESGPKSCTLYPEVGQALNINGQAPSASVFPRPSSNVRAIQAIFFAPLGRNATDQLWEAAAELGVTFFASSKYDSEHAALLREEAELQAKILDRDHLTHHRQWWIAERNRLTSLLHANRRAGLQDHNVDDVEQRTLRSRIESIDTEIDRLVEQEDQLTERWARLPSYSETSVDANQWSDRSEYRKPLGRLAASQASQLRQLDERLNRWRKTRKELRDHREAIEQSLLNLRLDTQLDVNVSQHTEPLAALETLERRIHQSQHTLEDFVGSGDTPTYWYDETPFSREVTPHLTHLQSELRDVCQRLAESEANHTKQHIVNQIQQLKRCERELSDSIEKLIEQRAKWIRTVGGNLQVDLHDYHPLMDSLNPGFETLNGTPYSSYSENGNGYILQRGFETQQLERRDIESRLSHIREVIAHRKALRSQLASQLKALPDAPRHERPYDLADLEQRIRECELAIQGWTNFEQLENRLAEVRRRLAAETSRPISVQDQAIFDRATTYYRGLVNDSTAELPTWAFPNQPTHTSRLDRNGFYTRAIPGEYQHDRLHRLDQASTHESIHHSRDLMELALRMAIAEAASAHIGRVPLVLDEPFLHRHLSLRNSVHGTYIDSLIRTLMDFASHGQQVVVLTADEEVASRVQALHGHLHRLRPAAVYHTSASTEPRFVYREALHHRPVENYLSDYAYQVNRELHAYANEMDLHRIDASLPYHRQRVVAANLNPVLTMASPIEQIPSMDTATVAWLREHSIATVGQFLATELDWVLEPRNATHYRRDPLGYPDTYASDGRVERMLRPKRSVLEKLRSEADLLCNIPQLRAFDARVLVECGVQSRDHLATIHPTDLLNRVENFVTTNRGQELLQSGTNYELSRLTAWLASAKRRVVARTFPVNSRARSFARNARPMNLSSSYAFRSPNEELQSVSDEFERASGRGSSGFFTVARESGARNQRGGHSGSPVHRSTHTQSMNRTASSYDRDGFDRHGFDRHGFDRNGWSRHGFNRNGYNRAGYDRNGYDKAGYDRDGYDKTGFDRRGYDRNGFDRTGYDRNGFNRDGYDRSKRQRPAATPHRSSRSIRSEPPTRSESQRQREPFEVKERSIRISHPQNRSSDDRRASRHRNEHERNYGERRRFDRDERGSKDVNRGREQERIDSPRTSESSQRVRRESRSRVLPMHTSQSTPSSAHGYGPKTLSGDHEELKFYLTTSAPVVDAPSIGPRTAERLLKCGIRTVADLLAADAAHVASKLNRKRITEDAIVAWQRQAMLVCRIPFLRGHDAQILVESEIYTPEKLASQSAATLLQVVSRVAGSQQGQRILRGSKEPDLAEVTDWIAWSKSCRSLQEAA